MKMRDIFDDYTRPRAMRRAISIALRPRLRFRADATYILAIASRISQGARPLLAIGHTISFHCYLLQRWPLRHYLSARAAHTQDARRREYEISAQFTTQLNTYRQHTLIYFRPSLSAPFISVTAFSVTYAAIFRRYHISHTTCHARR